MSKSPSKSFLAPVGFQDVLVLLALHSLVAVQMISFADDPGVGWHLRTGQYILANHTIPHADPFLYSATGPRPWVMGQWLGSLAIWVLYSAGSWPLVYGVLTVVFAITYLFVLYRASVALTGQRLLTTFMLIVPFKLGEVHFLLRPVLFSLFFFTIEYALLILLQLALQRGADPEKALRRCLWGLPLLFLFWANIHPEFAVGLSLLLVFAVGSGFDAWLHRREDFAKLARRFAILLCTCSAVTLINPRGIYLYKEIFGQLESFAWDHFIEWLPVDLRSIEGTVAQFSLVVLFISACFVPLRKILSSFEMIAVLMFALLGFTSVRVMPYYGIVVLVPLVKALTALGSSEVLGRLPRWSWYRGKLGALETREARSLGGGAILTALLALLLFDCTTHRKLILYEGPFGPSSQVYPYGAVEVLRDTNFEQGYAVVAAPLGWGGFLSFYGEGVLKPIIDDRSMVLGDEAYERHTRLLRIGEDWRGYLTDSGATHLLLPSGDPLALWIKESGVAAILYEDSVGIVFDTRSMSQSE